jgi:hypothetical protein
MNFLKIKLLVIAVIMFAASSAFASFSYDVTVNTSGFAGSTGYLYLQYATIDKAVSSTATVSLLSTDAIFGAQDTVNVTNGSAVHGTLPANVTFTNTNSVNDYNQAVTFGNTLSFLVSFASTPKADTPAVSTLSFGVFGDAFGGSPLLNVNDPNIAGTVAVINLFNDGGTSAQSFDASTTATPTPIPAAAYLLGSGLMGLFGIRRKKA